MTRHERWFQRARRQAPVASLLSGAFISVSVNEFTSIYATNALPPGWEILLVASVLSGISAAWWLRLSVVLAQVEQVVSTAPRSVDIARVEADLLARYGRPVTRAATLAIVFAVSGILVLPLRVVDWTFVSRLFDA